MAEKSYPLISLSKDLTILSRESIISSTKNWPWMCWKGSSLDLGQGAVWATAKPWQSSLSDATHVILASQHLSKSHIHFSSKLERCQDEALKVPENFLLFFCPELLLHPSSHRSEATFAKSHIIDVTQSMQLRAAPGNLYNSSNIRANKPVEVWKMIIYIRGGPLQICWGINDPTQLFSQDLYFDWSQTRLTPFHSQANFIF